MNKDLALKVKVNQVQLDHQINNCARDSRSVFTGSSKQQVAIIREDKQSIKKVNGGSYSLRSMK